MNFNPVPNGVEIRVICSLHGRQMALWIWAQNDSGPASSAALAVAAQSVRDHLRDNVWPLLGFAMFLQIVRAQDWSAGPGAVRTSFPASTAGGQPNPTLPAATALSLRLVPPPRIFWRPRGPNISGLPDAVVVGNDIDPTWADAVAAGWAGLSTALAAVGMTYVHVERVRAGAPLAEGFCLPVSGVEPNSYFVRNLRRRQAGYPAPI